MLGYKLKSDHDIAAPNIAAGPNDMVSMMAGITRVSNGDALGSVTGKPKALGGISLSSGSTGAGAARLIQHMQECLKIDIDSLSVALQGTGNAEFQFAQFVHKRDA